MITITLPWPPSTNAAWRSVSGRVLISAQGRAYRKAVLAEVATGRGRAAPLAGRLAVGIILHAPDRRRRDVDNYAKQLLDACTHAGLWLDDSQIDDLRIRRGEILKGGAVTLQVRELETRAAA